MLAKMSVDLRIAIDREGRLPDAVLIVFPEPKKAGQAAIRVNEYESNQRLDRVVDAVAAATEPETKGRVPVDNRVGPGVT